MAALAVLLLVASVAAGTSFANTKRGWLLYSEARLRLLTEPDEEDYVELACTEDDACHAYLRSGEAVRLNNGDWIYLVYNWSNDAVGTTWASNIGDVALAIDNTGQMYVSEQQQCAGWLVSVDSAAAMRSASEFWQHAGRHWRRYPGAPNGRADPAGGGRGDCEP